MSGTTTTAPTSSRSTVIGDYGRVAVSVIAQVLFMVALAIAYFTKDQASLLLMYGAIIANANTVAQYFLGSSTGSTQKSETIASMTPVASVTPVVPTTTTTTHAPTFSTPATTTTTTAP